MSEEELQLIKKETRGILHLTKYIKFWRYIEMLQKDSETLNKRLRKWEKWTTEKAILSSKMGEYLCKWQNVKREYTKQNKILTFKNQEIERQNKVINGMIDNEEKYNLEIIKLKSIIKKVYEYLDKKKDVPEWWDTDFMICMDILKGGTGDLRDILGVDKE